MTTARPGKGHLAAAPAPPSPGGGNQREALGELIAAAVKELLNGRPRGAELLVRAANMATSMSSTEILYAGVEAYAADLGALTKQLRTLEGQLQATEAQGRSATERLEAVADQARVEAARAMHERSVLLERLRAVERATERRTGPAKRRRPTPAPADDAAGQDRRPDPESARTPADLMAVLREFRRWAGEPSFRVMAERSGWGASTLNTALNSDDFPDRLAKIDAIVTGCGGNEEDRQRFASAWRRLRMQGPTIQDKEQVQPPAAVTGKAGEPPEPGKASSGQIITVNVGGNGKIRLADPA